MEDKSTQQPPPPPQETQGATPTGASGQTAETGSPRRLIAVIVAVVVVLGLAGGGLALNQARLNAEATQSAQSTATREEQIERTATADVQNTATARVQGSATARANAAATRAAQSTANAQATEQTASDILLAARSAALLFGPRNGSLAHWDDNFLVFYEATPRVRDFVAEAEFEVPYSRSVNTWDFGFRFRKTSWNSAMRFIVDSGGSWWLYDKVGSTFTLLDTGYARIRGSEGDRNTLTLIAIGDTGHVFVNDVYVTALDLSARNVEGYISVATGLFNGNEVNGESTRYYNFTVRRAP